LFKKGNFDVFPLEASLLSLLRPRKRGSALGREKLAMATHTLGGNFDGPIHAYDF
jgi:hypothetical protein